MRKKLGLTMLILSILMFSVTIFLAACNNESSNPEIKEEQGASQTIEVGETYSITPKYEGSTFSSSDQAIVTVTESGTVYGVAEGSTKVYEANKSVRVTYSFTVKAAEEEDEKTYTVKLDKEQFSATEESEYRLKATVLADDVATDDIVEWSIGNVEGSSYVGADTVELDDTNTNNVLIKAKAAGQALVHASYHGVKVSCAVTVVSESFQDLDSVTQTVTQGESVTWNAVEHAVHYYVSEDEGVTWTLNDERSYTIKSDGTPCEYALWIKAEGDGIVYGDSTKKVQVRTKLYLTVDDDVVEFVPDGSTRYDLYDGNELLVRDVEVSTDLKGLVRTGDYAFSIRTDSEDESNVCNYSTSLLNVREINSFDSKRLESDQCVLGTSSALSYSDEHRFGDSGYALKFDVKDTYNYYNIISAADLKDVEQFAFYVYIDGSSFKNRGQEPISSENLPEITRKEPFAGDDNSPHFKSPFNIDLAAGQSWGYDKWICLEGTRRADVPLTDDFEVNLFAFANSLGWTGDWNETQDSCKYFYTFYLDEFYARSDIQFAVNEDDTIQFTAEAGVTCKMYNAAGVEVVANVTDGYDLAANHAALGVTATGDYAFEVKFYDDGRFVESRSFLYSTVNINEKEINSYNSSRKKDEICAPWGEGKPESSPYTTHASLSSEQFFGASGSSLKITTFRQYSNWQIRSFNDLANVKTFSFKIFVDSTKVRDGDDKPVSAENLPEPVLAMFASSNEPVTCSLAEGETMGYDKWITVNVTKNHTRNEIIITGDARATGAFYYTTFYIDDVYATEYLPEA